MPVISRAMSRVNSRVSSRVTNWIARPHLPRRTVRLRMTLLYGGLFIVSGSALLAVTYVLVRNAVAGTPVKGLMTLPGNTPPPRPPAGLPGPSATPQPGEMSLLPARMADAIARQRSNVLHQLAVQSGIALALMSGLSIVLGWVVAGRMLRPLRTITAAAREISATSLHKRLALDAPSDELKELGDTVDGLLGRLEDSFKGQRQFVANASHELRTPLARQKVIGQVALADPGATVQTLRAAHERILAAGARQEQLIEALLTLARGHAGLNVRKPFDLARLAHEAIDSRRAEADHRTVTFRESIGPAVAAGHRNLAERLVTNLVDNALRHNMPHGQIDVLTRTVDGSAVLTVTNTGPLVPTASIDQLFQPFQRLSTTRAARVEGLGLGLSIVAAIANAHDANLTATAGPGGGLAVTVTFPPPGSGTHSERKELRAPDRQRSR
jgi:signal transduction histidine kinase